MATVLGVEAEELDRSTTVSCINPSDHDDLNMLVGLLKKKLKMSSNLKQLQLLTLAPNSWSMEKIAEEFDVSLYKVRHARKLKSDKGILAEPIPKQGKSLPEEVKERVVNFYQSDEHSRLLPGIKDFKSVTGPDGKRTRKQKRLILMNLNELHENFKARYPTDKIGLSKFCEFRPEHCITVGCRGTHSVCVCPIHQNVKLMINAIQTDTSVTYHDLMKKIVCSEKSNMCMVQRCPGSDSLLLHLEDICQASEMNNSEEIVHFKQWQTSDRATLQTCNKPLNQFLEDLVEKTDKLTAHHYIAKSQSSFLTHLKENLKSNEAIILLDFSENYSFIIQDAAQGFHWDNSQATLQPFVIYFHQNGELRHSSICVISDCLQHDTITVHTFQNVVLKHHKMIQPDFKKVHYFSDGAVSQYKNYKNFCNLVHHLDDFGLLAEWHFFATNHGKNACDGVGGTVKREAVKASLQAINSGHILTPRNLYDWGVAHISNVKFAKEEIAAHAQQQNTRFTTAKTVAGTRHFHSFTPTSNGTLNVRRTSHDYTFVETSVLRTICAPSAL